MSESLDAVPGYYIYPRKQPGEKMSVQYVPRDTRQAEGDTLLFKNCENAWLGVTAGETQFPFSRDKWDDALSNHGSLLTYLSPRVSKSWAQVGRDCTAIPVFFRILRTEPGSCNTLPPSLPAQEVPKDPELFMLPNKTAAKRVFGTLAPIEKVSQSGETSSVKYHLNSNIGGPQDEVDLQGVVVVSLRPDNCTADDATEETTRTLKNSLWG